MFKFSKPVIVQEEEKSHKEQQREFGPQKKSVFSLQTQDTVQATDAGQNKETTGSTVVIIIVILLGCLVVGVIGVGLYKSYKKGELRLFGGANIVKEASVRSNVMKASVVRESVPSIIDEEVSSILTNISQL